MTTMVGMQCGECGVEFQMPDVLYRECKDRQGKTWYCPNGHPRVFMQTLEQTVAILRKDLAEALHARDAAEQARAKLLARVEAGVCPHCKRTFQNLADHVKSKHAKRAAS